MAPTQAPPTFFLVATPAFVRGGLSRGGRGGALALIGVPLMALVVSPVQAAAIMLPILIVMDLVSLWAWRGFYDRRLLTIMLPGAVLGVGIGWLTAAVVTADHVRLIVGITTLAFFLRWVADKLRKSDRVAGHNWGKGLFWGTVSGFTSFVAHAGGPPYQVYALPLKHDPKLYTGTSVIFFAIVNAVKLIPYFALGQFDATNLTASLILAPIAPIATFAGAWIIRRMRPEVFYPLMYGMILVVSLNLIYEGTKGLWGW